MRVRLAIVMMSAVCSLGAAPKQPPLSESSFSTTGTNNQKLLQNIYAGRFEDVTVERDDVYFGFLYSKFLGEYGVRCKSSLPANKVMITKAVCDERVVTRNGWGVEVASRCLHWTDVPTGAYADPEMYAAKLVVEKNVDANALRQTMRLLGSAGKDPFAPAMNMLSTTADLEQDVDLLLRLNACGGPAMKRFQENLKRYALGKQSIALGATAKAPIALTASVRNSNYQALIEDLISDYATTWAMNRYISGSVHDVEVTADAVTARYRYNGFNPQSDGSLRIAFADGLPECMYFFDAPSSCKTPNRKIVAAYRDGKYRNEVAAPAPPPPVPSSTTVEVTAPSDTDFGDFGAYDELRVRKRVTLDVEPSDATVSMRGVDKPFRNLGKARSFTIDREPQLLLIRRAGYRDRLIVLTLDEEEGEETIKVWLLEDDR
jgi:hypothetical protein